MKLLSRFTRTVEDRGIRGGTEISIPGLFYRYDAKDGSAGHWRLFPRQIGGFIFLRKHWNRLVEDWASTRVWNILGLLTVIHVDAGPDGSLKSTTPPGWHFRFAKFSMGCVGYRTYGIMFHAAPSGYGS